MTNTGAPVSAPFNVEFYRDAATLPVNQLGDMRQEIPALDRDASAEIVFEVTNASAGTPQSWAIADVSNVIPETDEDDNASAPVQTAVSVDVDVYSVFQTAGYPLEVRLDGRGIRTRDILTDASLRNAMVVHAACGGSTNLVLHVPAIAFAAGLRRPTVQDWEDINRRTPRLVDALPNGPVGHSTVFVFLAGGVPEVMLHLRDLGLLDLVALTVTGEPLEKSLEWWERSERRRDFGHVRRERSHRVVCRKDELARE